MKRRSKAGGKAGKSARHEAATPRHRRAPPNAVPGRRSATIPQETEIARLARERDEALEQQAATLDVLQLISRSEGNLQPIFIVILEHATRLCQANFGALYLCEGDAYRTVAMHNAPAAFVEARTREPLVSMTGTTVLARVARTKRTIQVADMAEDPAYRNNPQNTELFVKLTGARSAVLVPMLKNDVLIGTIIIFRQEVRSFTDRQIELVQSFAAQAVIAIENARLLNELRGRTADLTESLAQQTATSEVLKVISSSPGELKPVFDKILENATRICEAKFGLLCSYDGNLFKYVAAWNAPPAFLEFIRQRGSFPPRAGTPLDRILKTKNIVHRADASVDEVLTDTVRLADAKSHLTVPMFKDEAVVGAIIIYRQEVRPFGEKQIALVENFAAQAVIAIESARLLDDLNRLNQQLEQRVTDQIGEIERMGRLRRFLPPQVADLIVASGTEKQLESHRREITALFCDLRGFTGFSESSDPEDVMALLRDYHAAIGAIIIKYSGTLERYAGDGVMVVFNDPVPVENPALQAVLMALELRDAIGVLTERWRRLGHEIGFGIGIAHGFATLGTIGFEGRFDYAAIGTVSNVASRLCDEAKPGQILVSPRVLMAVENAVTVEPVGEFALKGIRRPMMAYNVLASSA